MGAVVRIVATVAAIALWWRVAGDAMHDVGRALARIPPLAFGLGVLLAMTNFVVAAERFRTLLCAYGATSHVPSLGASLRLYLVGQFFNTALPGNVAGDLMRAHAARAALPSAGAFVVVLVERVFGIAALFMLTASVALLHGLAASPSLYLLTAAGLVAAGLGAAAPFAARAVGERIGGRVGALTRTIPTVTSRRGLLVGFLYALATQALGALAGYAVLAGLAPSVSVLDALALIPLALLATYFPTVAGLGARELAYVALLAPLGVGEAEATAAALAMLGIQLVIAALGGLLHVFAPRAATTS